MEVNEIRKLAKILIAIVFIGMLLTILGLVLPPLGAGLHYVFISVIGQGLYDALSGALSAALTWGASGGLLTAAAIFLPPFVFGIIISATIHQLWKKHMPVILGGQPKGQTLTISTSSSREEPRDIIMSENPSSTKKEEEKVAA